MEVLSCLRGLVRIGLLLWLAVFWLASFRLLLHGPARWQYRFFRGLAWLGLAGVALEVIVRAVFGLGLNWLHLTYGLLTALLLYSVSGLQPGGWFYSSLSKPLDKVGPYFFWASFIAILLWLRFTSTG